MLGVGDEIVDSPGAGNIEGTAKTVFADRSTKTAMAGLSPRIRRGLSFAYFPNPCNREEKTWPSPESQSCWERTGASQSIPPFEA